MKNILTLLRITAGNLGCKYSSNMTSTCGENGRKRARTITETDLQQDDSNKQVDITNALSNGAVNHDKKQMKHEETASTSTASSAGHRSPLAGNTTIQYDGRGPGSHLSRHEKNLLQSMVYRKFRKTDLALALNLRTRQQYEKMNLAKFRVVSYNVLSQDLIEANSYLYENCDRKCLQWEYRKANLLRDLDYADASVLCLQEVHHEHYENFFKPELEKRGYGGVYLKRTGNQNDGCATFFKKEVFQADEVVPIKYYQEGTYLLDRHNVAIAIKLSLVKHPDIKICVSNTHLLFNPRRGDIKLAQVMVLLANLDKLACYGLHENGEPQYHPVIMCGDMNMYPHCGLYHFLSTGQLFYTAIRIQNLTNQVHYGAENVLPLEFLGRNVGITYHAKFVDVVKERLSQYIWNENKQRNSNAAKCGKSEGDNLLENPSVAQGNPYTNPNIPRIPYSLQLPYATGIVSHGFSLNSVYSHFRGDDAEVTTNHGRANQTVDYIFYHGRRNELMSGSKHVCKRELRLLSRLDLLTSHEMSNLGGLPNSIVTSDHLMLCATFVIGLK